MSVILFSRTLEFQQFADVYETLKPLIGRRWRGTDEQFYKALRRLSFANVATYLCQYYVCEDELPAIDPFQELQGTPKANATLTECAAEFIHLWGHLKYNLITNDGEVYIAKQSHEFMDKLADCICSLALEPFERKA